MPVVLITGASHGLGLALVRRAAKDGWRVIATTQAAEPSEDLASLARGHEQVVTMPLDVTKEKSIVEAARRVERIAESIDLLFNNAGVNRKTLRKQGLVDTSSREEGLPAIERMLRVNALGPLKVVRTFRTLLERAPRPRVINISSDRASLTLKTEGGNYGYSASKAVLNMFTRALAADLRPSGITVLAMYPGWFQSSIGTPAAPLTAEEAATRVWRLAMRVDLRDSGRFLDTDGSDLPW